jgi:hypothetical protein
MKLNIGRDDLIPVEKWVTPGEIKGEVNVLKSPMIETAFQKILKDFIPKSEIAFLSLCTSTRPYNKSYKWKRIMNDFNSFFNIKFDYIVCSNGGIIPEQYWYSYPYLTYDAHGESDTDELYKEYFERRLIQFFERFHYKMVFADFRPSQRNREVVEKVLPKLKNQGKIDDFFISPSLDVWKRMKKDGFLNIQYEGIKSCSLMYPTFHPYSYHELLSEIKKIDTEGSHLDLF